MYPHRGVLHTVAQALVERLAGLAGPRINSDRRLDPAGPVYYRYGHFLPIFLASADGELASVFFDRNGVAHAADAQPKYSAPRYVRDPFSGRRVDRRDKDLSMLGGRYNPTKILRISAKGTIFRGRDLGNGAEPVIIKRAAAYVNEDPVFGDARQGLRNERRALHRLHDVDGFPSVLDHFRHAEDEFLVLSDVGTHNLRTDVTEGSPYRMRGRRHRDLMGLARRLLALLEEAHSHGVVVRDLTPDNVVIGPDRTWSIIDLEMAHVDGTGPSGLTVGYAPLSQEANERARPEDDYYALGATLFFAATALNPPQPGTNTEGKTKRMTDILGGATACAEFTDLVGGLMSRDIRSRCVAAHRIGDARRRAKPVITLRELEPISDADLQAAIDTVCAKASDHLKVIVCGIGADPTKSPVNVYSGASGIAMELAKLSSPERDELARATAYWIAGVTTYADFPLGLSFGSTGAAVFVGVAARALHDEYLMAIAKRIALSGRVRGGRIDYTHGLAGVGLGYLMLWNASGDRPYLDLAESCAAGILRSEAWREMRTASQRRGRGARTRMNFAHGLAGVTHFLLTYQKVTGDETHAAAAAEALQDCVSTTHLWEKRAHRPDASPMEASWCQGLAGMGALLARAAIGKGASATESTAAMAADRCMHLARRISWTYQCCGLAGVGELFLDLRMLSTDDPNMQQSYEVSARRIATLVVERFGLGMESQPNAGWGQGAAGVLGFLRRLGRNGSTRSWLADEVVGSLAGEPTLPLAQSNWG